MGRDVVVRGRYVDHQFIPSDPLPDTEGDAALVISPKKSSATGSVFDLFGTAENLRSAADIASELARQREEWGDA
jgi:hypothetical protein